MASCFKLDFHTSFSAIVEFMLQHTVVLVIMSCIVVLLWLNLSIRAVDLFWLTSSAYFCSCLLFQYDMWVLRELAKFLSKNNNVNKTIIAKSNFCRTKYFLKNENVGDLIGYYSWITSLDMFLIATFYSNFCECWVPSSVQFALEWNHILCLIHIISM